MTGKVLNFPLSGARSKLAELRNQEHDLLVKISGEGDKVKREELIQQFNKIKDEMFALAMELTDKLAKPTMSFNDRFGIDNKPVVVKNTIEYKHYRYIPPTEQPEE